jgi:hypothetical protein
LDHVITEFGYKDDVLHIHFYPGEKFVGDFFCAQEKFDKQIKQEFRKEIKETGKIIEEAISGIKDICYSAKFDEPYKFQKPSLFRKYGLPTDKPEEFEKANNMYKELMKLYDLPEVIHKTYTTKLLDQKWDKPSWGYVVHYKTPFIDDIMLQMCEQLESSLQ